MKAPRITLDQWKILQAVIDHGGYAQAAQALHCSQSSVSYNIARMQEQLAMPLLRIEGRKAVLTATGEILLSNLSISDLNNELIKKGVNKFEFTIPGDLPEKRHELK